MKKNRIEWLDALRGLAMIFVVLGHVLTKSFALRKYIYAFHMPLFFFISGVTFNDKLTFKEFTKKKAKSLLLPFIFINALTLIINIILLKTGVIDSIPKNQLPCIPSWFLLALFISELIFYGIKKISKEDDNKLFILSSICALISYTNSLSKYQVLTPLRIPSAFMGVLFMYLGYVFIKHEKDFDNLFNKNYKKIIFIILSITIGMITCTYNRKISMMSNNYGSIILFLVESILPILGLIVLTKLCFTKSKFLNNTGKWTLFILFIHKIIMYIISYFWMLSRTTYINIFITVIIILIISYIMSYFVYKYCPWIVGIFKNKQKN